MHPRVAPRYIGTAGLLCTPVSGRSHIEVSVVTRSKSLSSDRVPSKERTITQTVAALYFEHICCILK